MSTIAFKVNRKKDAPEIKDTNFYLPVSGNITCPGIETTQF